MTEKPQDIPQANQLLYTMKLVTGEEILCTLVDERETGLIIESPVQVRLIPVMEDGVFRNELSTCAWMPFSATRSFHISYRNIVAINQIHSASHVLYTKLVNRLEPDSTQTETSEHSFTVDPVKTVQ